MPVPAKGAGRYVAGLDGLRAIAVASVILYHLNIPGFLGGLLGVGIFFVLSGYLITDLLMAHWNTAGTIGFREFWVRRALRLLPALVVMLTVVVTWVAILDPSRLIALRQDVLASLLYVSNWWFIFHHVSYFAKFGSPSPLGHLWSLAIEEQFYLVWPVLLYFGLRFVPDRRYLAAATLLLATCSATAMALIYHPGVNPNRVYYGTDTRSFALLMGAALAMVWPSRTRAPISSKRRQIGLDVLGTLGLVGTVAMICGTNQYETFLYRGGMVLLSVAVMAIILAVTDPNTWMSRIIGWKPFRWMGERSYGIYLWHFPIIVLTTSAVDTGGVNVMRSVAQVLATLVIASLSWRYLEEPIRHGLLGRVWIECRRHWTAYKSLPGRAYWITLGSLVLLADFSVSMLVPVSAHATPLQPAGPIKAVTHQRPLSVSGPPETLIPIRFRNPHRVVPATPRVTTPPPTNRTSQDLTGKGVTIIGDSVLVDASPYLRQDMPGVVISAHIGRQLYQTPAVVSQLKSEGLLGPRAVVLELGTNGPFTQSQLLSLLHSLGPVHHIVLINTRVPRPWQIVVNSTLATVASSYPHTTLVNWYQNSANKNQLFYPDGVHLNPQGAKYYASLLVNALHSVLTKHGS